MNNKIYCQQPKAFYNQTVYYKKKSVNGFSKILPEIKAKKWEMPKTKKRKNLQVFTSSKNNKVSFKITNLYIIYKFFCSIPKLSIFSLR